MSPVRTRMSALEWDRRSETNRIEELVEGEVVVTPQPTIAHQMVVGRIFQALINWADLHDAGSVFMAPTGVQLAWDTVFEPDVLFVSRARAEIIQPARIVGAPDLVIEVLSPSTSARDRGKKMRLYETHGVREFWIVDVQARRFECHDLSEQGFQLTRQFCGGQRVESPQLSGFALGVDDVFALTPTP